MSSHSTHHPAPAEMREEEEESDPQLEHDSTQNMIIDHIQAAVEHVTQLHEAQDEVEWQDIIFRRGRARGVRARLGDPSTAEQNQALLRALGDSSSYERYHQMSICYELEAREHKCRNCELELEVARLQALYEWDQAEAHKTISQLTGYLSRYSRFVKAHNLSNAFDLCKHLNIQHETVEHHVKQYEDFVNSQNLSEAFILAHPA